MRAELILRDGTHCRVRPGAWRLWKWIRFIEFKVEFGASQATYPMTEARDIETARLIREQFAKEGNDIQRRVDQDILDMIKAQRVTQETSPAPEAPEKTWDCVCGRSNYVTVTRCERCGFQRGASLNRRVES